MASQVNVDNFKLLITSCLEKPIDDLLNSDEWGKINFEDIRTSVSKLFDMLEHFSSLPIEIMPEATLTSLIAELKKPKASIDAIKKFNIDGSNPTQEQKNISQNISQQIDQFYTTAHIWIPYLAYQQGDIQENIKKLNETVKNADNLLSVATEKSNNQKNELDSIINSAKEASATVGVGHFSSKFNEEAGYLKDNAKNWLVVTVVLAVASFGFTIWSYWIFHIADNATNAQIFQSVSTKIILIVILFTAMLWSGKMYRSVMHQYITNKHRANSLLTFQAFIKATNEPSVRDAVLLETTKSIFSLSPSVSNVNYFVRFRVNYLDRLVLKKIN